MESVKEEASRRGVSLGVVRKERQGRAELQPVPAPTLEVGKKYKNGFGNVVAIVKYDPASSPERPYLASTGEWFSERGQYLPECFVHLRKLSLQEV